MSVLRIDGLPLRLSGEDGSRQIIHIILYSCIMGQEKNKHEIVNEKANERTEKTEGWIYNKTEEEW